MILGFDPKVTPPKKKSWIRHWEGGEVNDYVITMYKIVHQNCPIFFHFSTKKIINQRRKRIFFVKNYNFCRKNESFRTFLVKK